MRISTQTLFDSGAARIGELQSSLYKTQQQVATGRRILTPSDDPVAAARALEVTQSQALNAQYGANRGYAKDSLAMVDGTLASVTELLQNVKTTAISAGNGTLDDSARAAIATALQSDLDQLVGLANTRDGQNNYLFSGFQTATPPFVQTATGATYQGDPGQRLIQVDSSRQMAVSSTGPAVFQGGGQDMFKTLSDLITQLNTPGTTGLSAALATADNNLVLALDNVSSVRASVGSRMQELDALDSAGADRNLQYSQTLSDLQDLDYAKALTDLSKQQTTLEAAQKSFVQVSGLSLFKLL
ncbi:MAG: flagellar hook-associated protein FlgL [Betaproteobacteria bacterium]|nr:flagellar hook-associated protein FlgL [Betaproteobacteria bacterium]